ncbi:acyltransferase [Clostridium sp. WILCCON 0269]|uniref:Acyltransferase n=1 Tax=Candidatus Clostridium eludens TaxID=3381663 RepID=A0ABW8SHC0_9CLOT
MDIIRAVAIVAVIILHVSATALYQCKPYSTTYNITFLLNQLSRFSVPAFIIISGMGLTINYKENFSYSKFIVKRFLKVVPQYVVWCVLYILIITKNFNIYGDLNDMVYGNVFYHFYFVPLIIEFYVIFPLIYRFIGKRWWLFFSLSITLFFLIYSYYFKVITPEQWFWNKKNLFYWLFYFSLGGYMGKNIDSISEKLNKHRIIICIMFLFSIFVMLCDLVLKNQYNKGIDYITTFQRPAVLIYSLFFILFIFSFRWKKGFFMDIIRYISNTSYDIYLSQAGIIYLYGQYYTAKYGQMGNLHFILSAFIVTLIGAVLLNEVKKLL